MNIEVTLRPLQDTDSKLIRIWLCKEHVLQWYHDTEDWLTEIKQRNKEFSFLHHYIVYYGDVAIGFCQYYDCFDAKETWYSVESKGHLFSIDYLIGEEDYLRKGYGKQIIALLINEISKENEHVEIIVQPDLENTASNKTLLASGFTYDNQKQYYSYTIGTQLHRKR
jgi:RimJ/RimL family protein N-acetyltransferase